MKFHLFTKFTPGKVYLTNNKLAHEKVSFVLLAISDLLVSGRVIELPTQHVVVIHK